MAHTWGSIYQNSVDRGDDHGYAAFLADQWERRKEKRLAREAVKQTDQTEQK